MMHVSTGSEISLNRLNRLLSGNKKSLAVFLTAGFPNLDSTIELVLTAERAGADFIEIGMPFSDPMADGPTIQAASQLALDNGMTLTRLIQQVRELRQHSDIPLVIMSYLNPLLRYGPGRLLDHAGQAGVDGFVIPDLLPDCGGRVAQELRTGPVGLNYLVSPNTTDNRIRTAAERSQSFLYCVSTKGTTGGTAEDTGSIIEFLRKVRRKVRKRCLVGFGITSGKQAAALAPHCDGVIVGSAILRLLREGNGAKPSIHAVADLISELKHSLTGAYSYGHR